MGKTRRGNPGRKRRRHHDRLIGLIVLVFAVVVSALFLAGANVSGDLRWLAGLSLFPVLIAIRAFSPWQAMLCGGLWGGSLCVFSIYSGPSAPTFTVLTVLFLVLSMAITAGYALAGALITRWIGFSPLVLATGWIGVELALQPLAMKHGVLAGALGDGLTMQLIGGLLGYVFVAFLVAYTNAWLLILASNIRLGIPRMQLRMCNDEPQGWLIPQSSFASPLPVICRTRPRAPPVRVD